jgi:hypothetical protein
MEHKIEKAKKILLENIKVRYGIFGIIAQSGYFPPSVFLNAFFMKGNDPCDQDQRMERWRPFKLSHEEYARMKDWWVTLHPGAMEDDFNLHTWDEWVTFLLEDK